MTLDPTEQRALEALIVAGMHDLTPTLDRDRKWKFNDDPEDVGTSLALRQFMLEWDDEEMLIGGATGNLDYEVEVLLHIVTHYGDMPFNRLGEVLGMDHFDINRYFGDRLETIYGLTNWQPAGRGEIDRGARVYEHRYRVSYLRR